MKKFADRVAILAEDDEVVRVLGEARHQPT
jgi:hypothetical protein